MVIVSRALHGNNRGWQIRGVPKIAHGMLHFSSNYELLLFIVAIREYCSSQTGCGTSIRHMVKYYIYLFFFVKYRYLSYFYVVDL